MTILAIAHYYIEHNAAGGELYLHRLLRELAKNHDVHVWVTKGDKSADTVLDGVFVHYHSQPTVKPDLIITHFILNTPIARELAAKYDTPIACIVHNEDPATIEDTAKFTECDLVIFNTNWIKDLTPTRAKAIVLHPPVDEQEFKTTPGDHITLVNVTSGKGSGTFYSLAERLPDEQFLGVTGGYFKRQFDHRHMPNVRIIPQTLNMRDDVYARSKIVLMPSIRETYGMVAREAFCSAIPVIAHPTKGLKENLGEAGIYINRDNINQWEVMIRWLNNPDNYRKQQEKIRHYMKTDSANQELAQAINAIESLVKE